MSDEPVTIGSPVADLSSELSAFLAANPEASLISLSERLEIQKPWGDDTLAFRVSQENTKLVDALNGVRLPPRLTAIWHLASRDLEIIWGPIRVEDELRSRKFTFTFRGASIRCEFGDASDVLPILADACLTVGTPTATDYRHLANLKEYLRYASKIRAQGRQPMHLPTSFWLRNVTVPEDTLPDLARHLNFFMAYFDRKTPKILVHEDDPAIVFGANPVRYPLGPFPANLTGKPLDPFLLALWESSHSAPDPIRQYLYSYQILEYAAFYHLREEISRGVRRILSTPDLIDRTAEASRQLLEVLAEDKTNDEAKLVAVVQQAADPAAVWAEIAPRTEFFSRPTDFEGGFSLPALIKKEWTLDDFIAAWHPKLPDSMRKLRNGIVHAREQRQARCVMPTRTNQGLMKPWAAIALAVANQVILYGEP